MFREDHHSRSCNALINLVVSPDSAGVTVSPESTRGKNQVSRPDLESGTVKCKSHPHPTGLGAGSGRHDIPTSKRGGSGELSISYDGGLFVSFTIQSTCVKQGSSSQTVEMEQIIVICNFFMLLVKQSV